MSVPTSLVQEQDKFGWQVVKAWLQFFTRHDAAVEAIYRAGPTADRPQKNLFAGMPYYDTTLKRGINYDPDGTWRDGAGTSV